MGLLQCAMDNERWADGSVDFNMQRSRKDSYQQHNGCPSIQHDDSGFFRDYTYLGEVDPEMRQ